MADSNKSPKELRKEAFDAKEKAQQLRDKYDSEDDVPAFQMKRINRFMDEAQEKHKLAEQLETKDKLDGLQDEPDPETKMKVADVESGDTKALVRPGDGSDKDWEFDTKAYAFLSPGRRDEVMADLGVKDIDFENKSFANMTDQEKQIHEAAWKAWLHSKGELANLTEWERKTYNTMRGDEGGFITPETTQSEIIRKLNDIVHIRNAARTIQISEPVNKFPTVESKFTTEWVRELIEVSRTDDEPFGKTTFDAESMKLILSISEELLADASLNVQGELTNEAAQNFAEQEEIAFLKGTGDNQPLGLLEADTLTSGSGSKYEFFLADFSRYWIVDLMQMNMKVLEEKYAENWEIGYRFWKRLDASPVDKDAFVLAQHDTEVTDVDIMNVVYSLKAQYRRNCRWLAHRNTIKEIRTITDGNDRFVWQPGLQKGEPATLAGFPVMESEFMPDPEA